jgi:outer membrane scaffolding protein for murein synthesis (MipA/OmpV family)
VAIPVSGEASVCVENSMIAIKKVLYMSVPLLTAAASGVQADDGTSSDSLTLGLGGQYVPRYSGSDKQVWQVVPVLQGRKGAFLLMRKKGRI